MSLPALLLMTGFAYTLIWGGLSFLRREGQSLRFVLEAVVITLAFSGLAQWGNVRTHPALFFVILYLVTMRVRLLVDLGNIFAKRAQFELADKLYNLAANLWPDATNSLIVKVNQGASLLQQKKLDEAIAIFNDILEQAKQGYLGVKYESAAHYNLGVAYLRKNLEAQAVVEFNAVLDTWPASEYARRAASALEQRRRKNMSAPGQEKQ